MSRSTLLAITCAVFVSTSGCIPLGDYYTVPWWKGVPATVVTPTSLEAMAWKEQHQERHQHWSEEDLYLSELPIEPTPDAPELR